MGFKITSGSGFHITFQNGYTISVQFGPGNYCELRNNSRSEFLEKSRDTDLHSANAEVAIWDVNNNWVTKQAVKDVFNDDAADEVVGWMSADGVAQLIEWTRKASPIIEMSAEEKLRELAEWIRNHPKAAQGMGDGPHSEWVELQLRARRILEGE